MWPFTKSKTQQRIEELSSVVSALRVRVANLETNNVIGVYSKDGRFGRSDVSLKRVVLNLLEVSNIELLHVPSKEAAVKFGKKKPQISLPDEERL